MLVVDDWAGCCHNYCKPVAKFPHDREALRQVILQGHERFFLGTDSAPHLKSAKENKKSAAGVFVTPFTAAYLASALDSFGALDRLHDFACVYGRKFYEITQPKVEEFGELKNIPMIVPREISCLDNDEINASIVPFMAGNELPFTLSLPRK